MCPSLEVWCILGNSVREKWLLIPMSSVPDKQKGIDMADLVEVENQVQLADVAEELI